MFWPELQLVAERSSLQQMFRSEGCMLLLDQHPWSENYEVRNTHMQLSSPPPPFPHPRTHATARWWKEYNTHLSGYWFQDFNLRKGIHSIHLVCNTFVPVWSCNRSPPLCERSWTFVVFSSIIHSLVRAHMNNTFNSILWIWINRIDL